MRLKFACWQRVPHQLCGVAHWHDGIARWCLLAVRADYRRNAAAGVGHHPLTRIFFQGAMSAEVDAFCDSDDPEGRFENFPLLHSWAGKLALVPVSERSAERGHAVIGNATLLCKVVSEPWISLRLRAIEISAAVADAVEFLKLAHHMSLVRSKAWCLMRLGHERHADLDDFRGEDGELQKPDVYHQGEIPPNDLPARSSITPTCAHCSQIIRCRRATRVAGPTRARGVLRFQRWQISSSRSTAPCTFVPAQIPPCGTAILTSEMMAALQGRGRQLRTWRSSALRLLKRASRPRACR